MSNQNEVVNLTSPTVQSNATSQAQSNAQQQQSNPQSQAQPNVQQQQQNVQPPIGQVQPNAGNILPIPAVNRIQVRVPPFWKQNPQLWFTQLEAQFANSNIIADLTKFNTIVGAVESDVLASVSDIVLNPPANNRYRTIKQRLIKEFADSDNRKLKSLLQEITIGDMKPSSFLRRMKELSCGKVPDNLLKNLWLQRLPVTMQHVLSTHAGSLEELAQLADVMFDISEAPQIQAISPDQGNNFDDLVNVVRQLEAKVESLKKDFRGSKESNGQKSRHRSSTPSKASSVNKHDTCFYHRKFGKKATKCRKPCNFQPPKPKNY